MITPSKKYDHSFTSKHSTPSVEVEIKFSFNSKFPATAMSREIIQASLDSSIPPVLQHLMDELLKGIVGISGGSV